MPISSRPRQTAATSWLARATLGLTFGALVALLPSVAHADVFGLKSRNAAQGGPLPTILFTFTANGSRLDRIGDVRLDGQSIHADGLALSAVHGLLAFHVGAGGSRLIRLDARSAVATAIGPLLGEREIRGAVFDEAERLLALDLRSSELLTVDPTSGLVVASVRLDVPIDRHGIVDVAVDAAGGLLLGQYAPPCVGAQFYALDPSNGHASRGYCESDTRAPERYPISFSGLAFAADDGEMRLFGLDCSDWEDDVYSYRPPLAAGNRRMDYRGILSEFNAGLGDLASRVAIATATPRPSPTATRTATATWTATATATPTPSTTASASPSPSPSRTATPPPPTATLTASPSPTASARACVPSLQASDVVLVVDRSSSMADNGKLGAAQAAVSAFVADVHAPPDQVALVSFATAAGVNQPLTTDKRRVVVATLGLITGAGTRIDLGLAAARGELAGPRHAPAHARVVILLSDGVQNGTPATTVVAEADAARAAGVILFTIALGSGADVTLLARIASSPAHAFVAPGGAQLREIYRRIAVEIPCPTQPPTRTPRSTNPPDPTGTPSLPIILTPTGGPTDSWRHIYLPFAATDRLP